jgi:hypothetical protein
MKKQFGFFIVLWLLFSIVASMASDVRVIISLPDQAPRHATGGL